MTKTAELRASRALVSRYLQSIGYPLDRTVYRRRGERNPATLVGGVVVLAAMLCAVPTQGFEFESGALQGSLDTTLSHGVTVRVGKRNATLAADTNGNDGNLNYDRGVVSNTTKFVTDLELSQEGYGVFVRTAGFLDFENEHGDRERTPLSEAAKERVGQDVEILDAYFTAGFEVGDVPVDVRIGKHVLNWGESTFIPNGINAINPFDVSKLRLPGSELREAMLPVGMASVTVDPNEAVSVTGFYQYDWAETRIDPVGSYFSSTDYVGPGAREAVVTSITGRDQGFGFGAGLTAMINCDLGAIAQLPLALGASPCPAAQFRPQRGQPLVDHDFASALRAPDNRPENGGQYGLALRHFAEDLNNTEFGFYFINYHSRLPVVSARTSSLQALSTGLAAAGAVGTPGSRTAQAVASQVRAQVQAGQLPPAQASAAIHQGLSNIASALAIDRYLDRAGDSGSYFIEYPEDIQLFGVSFNTVLGTSGWALQGEYSLRPNAPLQIAERFLFVRGLAPIVTALTVGPASLQGYQPRTVPGYVERKVSQVQATATRLFGPRLGADGLVFVAEAALLHVHDMPEVFLESPAGGTLAASANVFEKWASDADATSWGYRVAARLDYYNAVGSVNLYPYLQFLHDVSGNSPSPIGPFVEGRTALTVGLQADYLSRWQGNFGYTQYAGEGNELSDRDFLSLSVKYSF